VREEDGNEDEELGGDEPAEDERSLFKLAGAGEKLIFTPQNLQAILGVVYRNLDCPMPPQIMNFPSRRTLLRYMAKYFWRRRKPDRQGPHRFAGSAPDFLEQYIGALTRQFSELHIDNPWQVWYYDEILFCAEFDKVQRNLKVLVATKSDSDLRAEDRAVFIAAEKSQGRVVLAPVVSLEGNVICLEVIVPVSNITELDFLLLPESLRHKAHFATSNTCYQTSDTFKDFVRKEVLPRVARLRLEHNSPQACVILVLDGSSAHPMDDWCFLFECAAEGLFFQLLPFNTTHFTSLLDRFVFLYWKTWGKESLAIELYLEMEGQPRTPLAVALAFQQFEERFSKMNGTSGIVDATLDLDLLKWTADSLNRIGDTWGWRRLLKVVAPAGEAALRSETIRLSAAAVGFLDPVLMASRAATAQREGAGDADAGVLHEEDGSLHFFRDTILFHEHARGPREQYEAQAKYYADFESNAGTVAKGLGLMTFASERPPEVAIEAADVAEAEWAAFVGICQSSDAGADYVPPEGLRQWYALVLACHDHFSQRQARKTALKKYSAVGGVSLAELQQRAQTQSATATSELDSHAESAVDTAAKKIEVSMLAVDVINRKVFSKSKTTVREGNLAKAVSLASGGDLADLFVVRTGLREALEEIKTAARAAEAHLAGARDYADLRSQAKYQKQMLPKKFKGLVLEDRLADVKAATRDRHRSAVESIDDKRRGVVLPLHQLEQQLQTAFDSIRNLVAPHPPPSPTPSSAPPAGKRQRKGGGFGAVKG
jgi:hypothetical protein